MQADTVKENENRSRLRTLRIKLFADGADLDRILKMYANPLIRGFTSNPTLMFRRDALAAGYRIAAATSGGHVPAVAVAAPSRS